MFLSVGRRLVWGCLAMTVLAAAWEVDAVAAADRSEDDLLREGVEARRRADDARAFDLFERAYAVHHSARAEAQMGLAELALGRWLSAETHIDEALGSKSDPWVRKNRKALDDALARVRREVGRLEILGGTPGAEVVIKGDVVGTLPLAAPIHVRAGEVHFELRAAGYRSEGRVVQVAANQLARETVQLEHLEPVPATAAAAVSSTRNVPTTMPPLLVEQAPPPPPRTESHRGRIIGIALTGAGVVAAGAGLALGLKARAAGMTDSSSPTYNPNDRNTGKRYETLQFVGYGVGAALVIGGLTTYFVSAHSSSSSSETKLGLILVPASGGAFAGLGGTL